MPQINRDLNLVFPVEIGEGAAKRIHHVHSTPISMEVFDNYFLTLSSTYASMAEQGQAWLVAVGPRMALKMLTRIAKKDGAWEGNEGVEKGLLGEIYRLTNILMPTGNGWEQMPWSDVIARKLLPAEEIDEVNNTIVFFTSVWHTERRQKRTDFLTMIFGLFDGALTSSSVTEFERSLTILKPEEPSGETEPLSVIPI